MRVVVTDADRDGLSSRAVTLMVLLRRTTLLMMTSKMGYQTSHILSQKPAPSARFGLLTVRLVHSLVQIKEKDLALEKAKVRDISDTPRRTSIQGTGLPRSDMHEHALDFVHIRHQANQDAIESAAQERAQHAAALAEKDSLLEVGAPTLKLCLEGQLTF
jgi:hypothetical protein